MKLFDLGFVLILLTGLIIGAVVERKFNFIDRTIDAGNEAIYDYPVEGYPRR